MLILVYVFDWLCSVSHFVFLYQSLSSSLCMVFDAISYKIDEVLSINTSTNVFVFYTLTPTTRTGCPVLLESIDMVNSYVIFLF